MASTAGRSGLGILEMSHRNDLDPIQLIRNDIDGLVKMHIEGTFPVDEGIELERIKRNWTAHVNKLEELGLVGHDLQESLGKAFVGSAIRNGLDIDFSNEAAFVMEPFALFKDIDGGLNFIAFKYAPKGGSVEPVGEKSYVIPTHLMTQIAHSGNTRSDRRSGVHQKSNKPGNNLNYVLAGGALVLLGLLSQTPVGRSIIGKFNSSVDTSAAILNTPIATENAELPDVTPTLSYTHTPEPPTLEPTIFVTPTDTLGPPDDTDELEKLTLSLSEEMPANVVSMTRSSSSSDKIAPNDGDASDNINLLENFASILKIAGGKEAVANLESLQGIQPFSLRVFEESDKATLATYLPEHIPIESLNALEKAGWKIIFVGHNYIDSGKLTFADMFGVNGVVTGSYNTGHDVLPEHLAAGVNDSVIKNIAIGVNHDEFLRINDEMERFGFSPLFHFVVEVPEGATGINLPEQINHTQGVIVIPPGASLEEFVKSILNYYGQSGSQLAGSELWKILDLLINGTTLVTSKN